MTDVKSLVRIPLIIAAALVVVRLVLELLGLSESITNVFGVAWLYLLVPFYFASQIAKTGEPKPYMALAKTLVIFALITRLFIAPTYWLAYAMNWGATRFALDNGGVVGAGVTSLEGYLLIPFRNLVIWTIVATVVGMILGGITLAVRKRSAAPQAT